MKNVKVSEIASDWFASIQVELEVGVGAVNRGVEIGIDLGGVQPIVLPDSTVIDHASRRRTGIAW